MLKFRAQPWLESPLRTATGQIELAGMLHNVHGIDPAAMRVLHYFTLVLLVSGRAYYQDRGGVRTELAPGDVILVFPGLAHAYGPLDQGEWTQVYFVFAGAQFDLWREQQLLDPARPVLRVGMPDYWKQRLFEVVKSDAHHAVGAPLRAMGRFLQVLTELRAADLENERLGAGATWLEKSLRLLGDRSEGGWTSPQQVAREVGLSYENFRKRFAALTGESPGHYQRRRRIDWACAAIYHGEHSLKRIADELEFCDVYHFSKAFKQTMSVTPSEYRRRVRGR
ncbi:AraC family transcriptional regulator [Opitutus sp. ER46]|uniref:helix-turn-helix domain-containing protein n=1 Tax=Opitutus sp. ER46 TaxID=2161864 RepID=UPI000D30901C|nr:AraC family transcriptional regulator [Opitutus sp. ER46]PTX94467.1 hypothetical protein DB354_12035 [Opitutus sp. ER46]